MPFISVEGARLFYRLDGRDDRPTIVFSHSLGTDHTLWDRQAADLLAYFRVLRIDTRGHGASDSTPGDYSIERLSRDLIAVADALHVAKFAFCGLSLGGMIGQWLGAHAADRVTHLVLANTSPKLNNPGLMEERRAKVLKDGMGVIADSVMQRFFTQESLTANPPDVASARRTLLATNPVGYGGCCAAIRDLNNVPLLKSIHTPTLVIFGERDISTPWTANGDILASSIHGAQVAGLPTAHLSNLEAPRSFSAALFDFLMPRPTADVLESGSARRREVLGDAHIDRAAANTTAFNRDFQEMLTRYAWGTIWTRPYLDQRTRRMMALATLAARGAWEEFRMHIRTGLAHELEPCDVKELLLQISIYAGVPAANTGFGIAAEEVNDAGKKSN